MRVFKNKLFARWAGGEGISDDVLLETIHNMVDGHRVAALGGNVYKSRLGMSPSKLNTAINGGALIELKVVNK